MRGPEAKPREEDERQFLRSRGRLPEAASRDSGTPPYPARCTALRVRVSAEPASCGLSGASGLEGEKLVPFGAKVAEPALS